MVLHLQNFDIIRIFVPQTAKIDHHAGKNCLDRLFFIAGYGEHQGDTSLLVLDPDFCLGAAHIIDGGFCHGNNSGDGGTDDVGACLSVTAVTRDTKTGDPVILGEKFASSHSVLLQCDLGDLDLGVGLTMTDLLLLALLSLVAQDVDLLALAVLDDLSRPQQREHRR